MSAYVKKIQFKLHESYGNPLRGGFCIWAFVPRTGILISSTEALSPVLTLVFPAAVVTKPPYEITETGWGEFEIIIKIFFIDPNERPVSTLNF